MKKILSYIVIMLTLVACSQEEELAMSGVTNEGGGVTATLPELNVVNESGMTRSSLYYSKADKKMLFSWEDNDQIGVFNVSDDDEAAKSQQQKFILAEKSSDLFGHFATEEGVRTVEKSKYYVGITPFIKGHDKDYTNIKISYANQETSDFPKMRYYKFSGYDNDDANDDTYNASEKAATLNLPKIDYCVPAKSQSAEDGNLGLSFKRIAGIFRFYMKCPNEEIYDSLILVNNDVEFTVDATLNLYDKETETYKLTPTKKHHAISVKFKVGEKDGLDMSKPSTDSKDYYNDGAGYIITYIMCAPIDLSKAEYCTLYLCGHTTNTPAVRKYYRATVTSKPNLKANDLYQWNAKPGLDEPITFEPINVQQWKEGTTFENKDGKGTEGW